MPARRFFKSRSKPIGKTGSQTIQDKNNASYIKSKNKEQWPECVVYQSTSTHSRYVNGNRLLLSLICFNLVQKCKFNLLLLILNIYFCAAFYKDFRHIVTLSSVIMMRHVVVMEKVWILGFGNIFWRTWLFMYELLHWLSHMKSDHLSSMRDWNYT